MKRILPPLFLPATVLLTFVPLFTRTTNCGGNSAALTYTSRVAGQLLIRNMETPMRQPVAFEDLVPREEWSEFFQFGWRMESYWVRGIWEPESADPIILCAQEFSNIPQSSLQTCIEKPGPRRGVCGWQKPHPLSQGIQRPAAGELCVSEAGCSTLNP